MLHSTKIIVYIFKGAAVAEWLSSWFAGQEVWGSIPGLATWIWMIGYILLPSRDMAEIPLKPCKSSIQPTSIYIFKKKNKNKLSHYIQTNFTPF